MKKSGRVGHIVTEVLPGSIAEEMGIEPGDAVVAVDGNAIEDIFDYRFGMASEFVTVTVEDAQGEQYLLEIEKDEDEDLGVVFDEPLMDDYRRCSNGCIFCFIDQMPPGMRETLYFKDDDTRLSFLQGNYVTLTNMSEKDIERICRYRMEPVNISIHTTDPALRVKMLKNKNAGRALAHLDTLSEAGITMNGQVVLCKGWNDGEHLEETIRTCEKWMPQMRSLSVVPVGLTKYREGLEDLVPFTAEDASSVIGLIEERQRYFRERYGTGFVYASDEWYLLAGRTLPDAASYDGYPQLENGVGMLRNFIAESNEAIREESAIEIRGAKKENYLLATGLLAADAVRGFAERFTEAFPHISLAVLPVRNEFFGERITVAGLVTGGDLIRQTEAYLNALPDEERPSALYIPCEMLRMGETVFLDDTTVRDVEDACGLSVRILPVSGGETVRSILYGLSDETGRRQNYEQADRGSSRQTECR